MDAELQSDFARYLCVLVSGYLEKSVYELAVEHSRKTGGPSLQRFVDRQTRRFTNANFTKLKQLMGAFDPVWATELDDNVDASLKDAVNAVVDLRNRIAHGGSVGVTYGTVVDYFLRVQQVVDFIADLCVPLSV